MLSGPGVEMVLADDSTPSEEHATYWLLGDHQGSV
jgi:hypothetical protein